MHLKHLLLATMLCVLAAAEEAHKSDRSDFKKSLSRDCSNSYSTTCLKLDIVSWVDKLNEDDNLSVLPGVTVVRENNSARANTADIVADLARDFPNDPEARLDAFMMKKVTGYLNTHSIKLNFWETDAEEARKKKGGNGLGMMMAAAAMMKGTLMALALGGLAALAGKALMTGLISLLLSAIIGLKSLALILNPMKITEGITGIHPMEGASTCLYLSDSSQTF